MTTALFVRRFLTDYARNPVNLLFLVLVPVVFVMVAAGSLADAARLLGGAGGGAAVETVTAGGRPRSSRASPCTSRPPLPVTRTAASSSPGSRRPGW